jgi:hypothetical protein
MAHVTVSAANDVTAPASPPISDGSRPVRDLTALGAGTVVLAVFGVAVVQYFMPGGFDNAPGVNPGGLQQFAQSLGLTTLPSLSVEIFVWTWRLLILAAWAGYAALLVSAHHTTSRRAHWVTPVVIGTPLALAFLFPPSLSADVYAYAGWGRMMALHAWNPYTHTLAELAKLGDPAAALIPVAAPSNHGPVWNLTAGTLVVLLGRAGVWGQVLALKLVAGVALVIAAFVARSITRTYEPQRADLTLLAVGLNPLLLIEGPGSGHNDIVMVAVMLAGLAAHARGARRAGYILVGLSAGVKFITLALVPWMIVSDVREHSASRAGAAAIIALGLALAPTVVAYAAFWEGRATFEGIRRVYEQKIDVGSDGPETSIGRGTYAARRERVGFVTRLVLLGLLHAGVTLAILRRPANDMPLAGWSWFALLLAWVVMPVTFCWYMIWPWSTTLTRWSAPNRPVLIASGVLSLFLTWVYTVRLAG